MVSDHGFVPMVSDDHGGSMITHHGWHAMIANHEAAAIIAAVAGCGSIVNSNKSETGRERNGNAGQRPDISFHGRLLFDT
ncbi:hypothetical protein HPT29_023145 [Microvirga terrae]|uniref:Uncharacterized protein n=2 Tax=Microvirga TaxID=186650 RepID=A0ABY5RPV7_9HYPH|nr:hypothetical protein [Microvirga terrae]UVF19293.1 hypothetical protein HPT29_023145 [Microvirga terrae]